MAKAQTLVAQVRDLRQRIETLQRERNTLGRVAANGPETERLVKRWAESAAIEGADLLKTIAAGVRTRGNISTAGITTGPHSRIDLGALLAAVLGPDAIAAAVIAQMPEHTSLPDAAGRALRLDGIDQELFSLGAEEEALIVASEATPEPILRRVDVDPRVVLDLP
jgi:hypothetical protein